MTKENRGRLLRNFSRDSQIFLISKIGRMLRLLLQVGGNDIKDSDPWEIAEFIWNLFCSEIVSTTTCLSAAWDKQGWLSCGNDGSQFRNGWGGERLGFGVGVISFSRVVHYARVFILAVYESQYDSCSEN